MYQGLTTLSERHQPIGSRPPRGRRTPLGAVAFLALIIAPFVALTYPLAAVAAVAGTVALAVLSRSVLRTLRRRSGQVQTLTLPGLGTVEYCITTN